MQLHGQTSTHAVSFVLTHGSAITYAILRSEEHTSELQSLTNLVCRLLLEKNKYKLPEFEITKDLAENTILLTGPLLEILSTPIRDIENGLESIPCSVADCVNEEIELDS